VTQNISKEQEMRRIIASIGDQICDTLDNNFDIHVSVDTDDIQGQKLSVLVNFLLENVRRSISDMHALTAQLEDKVKERTEILNLVIEGSNDAVWIWHLDNDSIEFSSHWFALLGDVDHPLTVPAQDWFANVHPKDIARLRLAIARVVEGDDQYLRVEYRIKTSSGNYVWILCRGVCRHDEHGETHILAGTQTDISSIRSFDAWSGIPNESFLREYLQDELESERRFYLLFFSINQFDVLAESLDNETLNSLRRSIIQRILSAIQPDVILARLPNDMFALTGMLDSHTLANWCDELNDMFKGSFTLDTGSTLYLSLAIGAIDTHELNPLHTDDLFNYAWTALREARKSQTICIYDRSKKDKHVRLAFLEHELRLGINNGMVTAQLQPIIDTSNNQISGFEALARFNHPRLGYVSPAEFIPLAEERGLMSLLGDCVLQQALVMGKALLTDSKLNATFYIAVNISAKQFEGAGLAERILGMLAAHALPPSYLRLEVTESTFMKDMDLVLAELSILRDAGIKIALDDFGTGYSSLSYLRHLPIDVLKIDRSFIIDLDQHRDNEAIVNTVYGLAQLLALDVVAEGVETQQELATLNKIGAMKVQGYLYSKPLAWKDVPAFIERYVQLNHRD
jgi:EAL domain-containing protein (putative c-di-GMP-specific phosphodiesterase class I)/GGDEF domain-containing protein